MIGVLIILIACLAASLIVVVRVDAHRRDQVYADGMAQGRYLEALAQNPPGVVKIDTRKLAEALEKAARSIVAARLRTPDTSDKTKVDER